MKLSLGIIALASLLSLSVSAQDIVNFSNSDFEATNIQAERVASATAENFAAELGVDVVSIDKASGSRSLAAKYAVQTNTDCEFVVSVGLFFRSKISSAQNCQ